MHVKAMMLDGEVLVTGSHNFTKNSAKHCVEILNVTRSADLIKEFRQYFAHVYNESHEVTFEFLEELLLPSKPAPRGPSPGAV